MKGLSKVLGRGLLVLALGCLAVACGDDDDKPVPDGGAGTGGTSGSSGKGGSSGSAGKAGSTPDKDGSTTADCAGTAKEMSGDMANAKCTACLCDMKEKETIACTKDCWKLAYCVAANCDASDIACIQAKCADAVGGAANLAGAGTLARATPFTACAADCFGAPNPGDAEVSDGGN